MNIDCHLLNSRFAMREEWDLEPTLPMTTLAAFQLLSLGILPLGASSTMTAAATLITADGGEPKDFNSVKLF